MLINFNQIPETVIPNMRGGEGQVVSRMHVDGDNKIMKGFLAPGCEHSLINDSDGGLTFFAVVPEHGA